MRKSTVSRRSTRRTLTPTCNFDGCAGCFVCFKINPTQPPTPPRQAGRVRFASPLKSFAEAGTGYPPPGTTRDLQLDHVTTSNVVTCDTPSLQGMNATNEESHETPQTPIYPRTEPPTITKPKRKKWTRE